LMTTAATIGVTQTALPTASAGLYDHGPALRVQLVRGALASVSLDEVLSGSSLAAIGDGSAGNWEIFQFADCDLVGEDTYELSTRLRGQAGSNGVMPQEWPAGSIFVLLNAVPEQIALASSARGVTQHYRYGPGTRPLSDPSYQYRTEAFAGIGLRPYSVAHLGATANGTATDVTWIRRARIGGDNWDAEEVPLAEAFERYRVRVFKDGVEVRQATVTAPNWTYTAGMQFVDGAGETQITVTQLSEVFGEGPAARLDLVG